jgi:hypothetical protein
MTLNELPECARLFKRIGITDHLDLLNYPIPI